ncbi:MAG: hypothetical protein E5V72_02745 [Mesorhizobium sp.]|nr:MAG: hypothetical protein E5V72_02745 [Mesorhizobium sp.]
MADNVDIQQILRELSALERLINDPATLRFLKSPAEEQTIKTFGRKITNGWEEALDEALRGLKNIRTIVEFAASPRNRSRRIGRT